MVPESSPVPDIARGVKPQRRRRQGKLRLHRRTKLQIQVDQFLEWFSAEHERRGHGRYVINNPSDKRAAKSMIKALGIDRLKYRAQLFFTGEARDNYWMVQRGYDVFALRKTINALFVDPQEEFNYTQQSWLTR